MIFPENSPAWQIQNLAYLAILGAIWTGALAVIMPGTGVVEALAAINLFLAILSVLLLPVNWWAMVLILLGLIAFLLEIRKPVKGLFMVFAMVFFALGSVFIFQGPNGELAGVSWWLAAVGTALTAGFFWLAVSRSLLANRVVMDFGPDRVVNQIGEAKTDIQGSGTIQVASALWSARSEKRIPAGSKIRVTSRSGLILTVQKEE